MVASHFAGSFGGHVAPQCQLPPISGSSGQPARLSASRVHTSLGIVTRNFEAATLRRGAVVLLEHFSEVTLGIFTRILLVWAIAQRGDEVTILGDACGQRRGRTVHEVTVRDRPPLHPFGRILPVHRWTLAWRGFVASRGQRTVQSKPHPIAAAIVPVVATLPVICADAKATEKQHDAKSQKGRESERASHK